MSRKKFIICDEDAAYVQALSTYIISSINSVEIISYSDKERFRNDRQEYDVALLGKAFVDVLEDDPGREKGYGELFILTNDMNESVLNYRVIYKFQKMDTFLGRLLRAGSGKRTTANRNGIRPGWVGIFSPIHHELQLLFSFAFCKQRKEKDPSKSVLFIDLEENSPIRELMDDESRKNITDYLYLLEDKEVSREELSDCLSYTAGFAYLSPARYFQELLKVNEKRWEAFFDSIAGLGFDEVVVLFGDSFRGSEVLLPQVGWLVLVTKEGDFYQCRSGQIKAFLKEKGWKPKIHGVNLPLSGAKLVNGSHQIERLLAGNISGYALRVIKEMEERGGSEAGKA